MRALAFAALIGSGAAAAAADPQSSKSPRPAGTMRLTATAYCDSGTTRSGAQTHVGMLAADPEVLPVGSVLRIMDGATTGIYTVMDTGPAVKGRRIDIFMPDCAAAKEFGERPVRVRVLRRGWDPKNSTP